MKLNLTNPVHEETEENIVILKGVEHEFSFPTWFFFYFIVVSANVAFHSNSLHNIAVSVLGLKI